MEERDGKQKTRRGFYLKPDEQERLSGIKTFLEQNLEQHYTIPQLSKKALMNEFKLKKGFKIMFHKSLHDFHVQIRMKEAERLLKTTTIPLEEVAEKVGYSYVSSFIVVFKKLYKITPATFRRNTWDENDLTPT